jgi:hypothetical protein
MMRSRRLWTIFELSLFGLAACVNQSTVGPVSAPAAGVRVENDNPPAGARLVGPITVSDGDRCTLTGARGTRAGATVLMQEAAKRQGMDWVKVVMVTRPYEGHDCFHGEYTLKGVGYSLAALRPAAAPSAKPSVVNATPSASAPSTASTMPIVADAPAVLVSAAPGAVTAAPPTTSAAPPIASAAACSPPCSPGYACSAGVCVAECNPACVAGQICRSDRVCVPAH